MGNNSPFVYKLALVLPDKFALDDPNLLAPRGSLS
jgi:hypothetical protein